MTTILYDKFLPHDRDQTGTLTRTRNTLEDRQPAYLHDYSVDVLLKQNDIPSEALSTTHTSQLER